MAVARGVSLPTAVAAACGWTYALAPLRWLSSGQRLSDGLPLLQLAGEDSESLQRLALPFVLGGLIAGYAL